MIGRTQYSGVYAPPSLIALRVRCARCGANMEQHSTKPLARCIAARCKNRGRWRAWA